MGRSFDTESDAIRRLRDRKGGGRYKIVGAWVNLLSRMAQSNSQRTIKQSLR
jgi:hypothetical protein